MTPLQDARFVPLLGEAVVRVWGSLPQEIQRMLFEAAVSAGEGAGGDPHLREHLAAFLHDHHPRTG